MTLAQIAMLYAGPSLLILTYCETVDDKGAPPHDASPRCESGKHNHCTCDTCW